MDNGTAHGAPGAPQAAAAEGPPVLLDDEQTARIVGLLKRLRLSRKELGAAAGYSQSSVSHMLADAPEGRRAMPRRVLAELAERAGWSVERVLAGSGTEGGAHEVAEAGGAGNRNLNAEVLDYARLPRRPLVQWGQCGLPSPAEGLTLEGWEGETVAIPEEAGILAEIGPRGFAVRIKGGSMAGVGIRDGDVLFVNPDRGRGAYYGQPVLARLLDEAGGDLGMVVKLLHLDDEGREFLQGRGLNGDHGPRYYRFEVFGPCVSKMRLGPAMEPSDDGTGGGGGPREGSGGAVFLGGPRPPAAGNGHGNESNGHDPAAVVIGLPPATPLRRAG